MKKDIINTEDIRLLVDTFYIRVKTDNLIGPVFQEVIQTKWDSHMKVMYAFWEKILLGNPGYNSNPMEKHIELDKKYKLEKPHFDQWLKMFTETIDVLFEGPMAETCKTRARNIAPLMLHIVEKARE